MAKFFTAANTSNPDIKAIVFKMNNEVVANIRIFNYMNQDLDRANSFIDGFVQLYEKELEKNSKNRD